MTSLTRPRTCEALIPEVPERTLSTSSYLNAVRAFSMTGPERVPRFTASASHAHGGCKRGMDRYRRVGSSEAASLLRRSVTLLGWITTFHHGGHEQAHASLGGIPSEDPTVAVHCPDNTRGGDDRCWRRRAQNGGIRDRSAITYGKSRRSLLWRYETQHDAGFCWRASNE